MTNRFRVSVNVCLVITTITWGLLVPNVSLGDDQKFFAFDGGFSVVTNELPELLIGPFNGMDVFVYKFDRGGTTWTVSFFDVPDLLGNETQVFEGMVHGLRQRGQVVFQERTKVAGFPALRFAAMEGKTRNLGLTVCVGQRLFKLLRYSERGDVSKWDESDRLLNSFVPDRVQIESFRKEWELAKRDKFGTETFSRLFRLSRQPEIPLEAVSVCRALLCATVASQGLKHADSILHLGELGRRLTQRNQFAEALFDHQLALANSIALHGATHEATVAEHDGLAFLLRNLSDFDGARSHLEKSLAAKRQTKGKDSREVAHTLFVIAGVCFAQGQLSEAAESAHQSLSIFRKIDSGNDREGIAALLDLLGKVSTESRQFAQARSHLTEALAIRRSIHGSDHELFAVTAHNLGMLELAEGNFAGAREQFDNALKIMLRTIGPRHLTTLEFRRSLALALAELGHDDEAEKHLLDVLAIRREFFDRPNLAVAAALSDLACLFLDRGKLPEATKYLSEAWEIDRQIDVRQQPDPEAIASNLGAVYLQLGKLDQAEEAFQAARLRSEQKFGKSHPRLTIPVISLGEVALLRRDFSAAKKYFREAESFLISSVADRHPDRADISLRLANVHQLLQQPDQAAEEFQKARQSARSYVTHQLSSLPEDEQLRFLAFHDRPALDDALRFGISPPTQTRFVARSAEWLINGKAIAAEVFADVSAFMKTHASPEVAAVMRDLASVRESLSRSYFQEIETEPVLEASELTKLASRERELMRELVRLGVRSERQTPWIALEEIRQSLPKDAVYIDILRLPSGTSALPQGRSSKGASDQSRYVAWIVPPTGQGDVTAIDLGPAEAIEELIGQVRQRLQKVQQSLVKGERDAEQSFSETTRALAEKLFVPLRKTGLLTHAKQLILSPDGALWLISWDYLPVSEGRYLVEDFRVRYILSGRDLMVKASQPQKPSAAIIVANPDFDQASATVADKSATRSTRPARIPEATALPATEAEARAILENVAQYSQTKPQVFLQKAASEEVVKSVVRPAVLVLATHGFFFETQHAASNSVAAAGSFASEFLPVRDATGQRLDNPLLRCGLMFAGCNRRETSQALNDGLLTGLEVLGLDLKGTRLVVLSACETGVGEPQFGEGVAGLRHAFVLAGAESVVSTLWNVADLETARLMNVFFKHLADGKSRSEALHQAKLDQIQSRRKRFGAAHPFFWASFTLTGRE